MVAGEGGAPVHTPEPEPEARAPLSPAGPGRNSVTTPIVYLQKWGPKPPEESYYPDEQGFRFRV
jgi:hypothetical protein